MSNTPYTSRGFKWSLTSIGAVLGLIITVSPYFNLVNRVQAAESEIKAMKQKYEIDHDLLIQISSDIRYIKEQVIRK